MPLKNVRGSVWGVTAAAVPVELRLEADGLPNRDTLSLSDPFAVISSTHFGGGYEEIGRTETVWDELSPRWATALPFQYVPGVNATALRIEVYDLDTADGDDLEKQDFLGCTYTTLADVLNAPDGSLTLPLVERDEEGVDAKTAASAAAAARAAAGGSARAGAPPTPGRRKRGAVTLGTVCLSAEVVHTTLRPEWALAAATAIVSTARRAPACDADGPNSDGSSSKGSARGRPPMPGRGKANEGKSGDGGETPPQSTSGTRLGGAAPLLGSRVTKCSTTQPSLATLPSDVHPADAASPPRFSFSVSIPPVYRRGLMASRSLAQPLMVVERSRPSGGGWSTLYHTAALEREAYGAAGVGRFQAVTFAAAALHNGDCRRRLRVSFHDYHMRSSTNRIAQATFSYEELLAAAPAKAWPMLAAEAPSEAVGTLTFTAVRRVGVGGRGSGGSNSDSGDGGEATGAVSKMALMDAVGDATDATEVTEVEVRVEWMAMATRTFVGGTMSDAAMAAAAADVDAAAISHADSGDSTDAVEQPTSWTPRSAARRVTKRSAAAFFGGGGGGGGLGEAHSPAVVGGAARAADGTFASHAPIGEGDSLTAKLKKSMALR